MKTIVLGAIAIIILFFANLAWGSVSIPWQEVVAILAGNQGDEADSFRYIVMELRLPAAITALLSGAALATAACCCRPPSATPWPVLTSSE